MQECGIPNIKGEIQYVDGYADYVGRNYIAPIKSGCVSYKDLVGRPYSPSNIRTFWSFDLLIDANLSNRIYKDNHNDVTPYNFNINLLVKI